MFLITCIGYQPISKSQILADNVYPKDCLSALKAYPSIPLFNAAFGTLFHASRFLRYRPGPFENDIEYSQVSLSISQVEI